MHTEEKPRMTPDNVVEVLLDLASNVEKLYIDNADPNYDATPMFFGVRFDDEIQGMIVPLVAPDGDIPPPAMLKLIVESLEPDAYAFLSAGWIKDPVTRERVGENVMITIETRDQQLGWAYTVTRDPLPVLGPRTKMDDVSGRCCNLLSPKPTEH